MFSAFEKVDGSVEVLVKPQFSHQMRALRPSKGVPAMARALATDRAASPRPAHIANRTLKEPLGERRMDAQKSYKKSASL